MMQTIGIVGPGRVGKALACLLTEGGYTVMLVSRHEEHRSEIINGSRIVFTTLDELGQKADLIFLTTPDAVIPQISERLAKKGLKAGSVLHCSGALSSKALISLKEQGIKTGSLHPLQSFATLEQALLNLPGSLFTYEGDMELLEWVKSLVGVLGGSLKILDDPREKIIYHAGACLVSNYLVALADLGIKCLQETGFTEREARGALVTLMEGTLSNLSCLTPDEALTGPISRGDSEVVASHISALKSSLPDVGVIYEALTPPTADIAYRSGRLSACRYKEITNLVKGGTWDVQDNC